jgi:transcriptional regulator with XRE-family HTH domain
MPMPFTWNISACQCPTSACDCATRARSASSPSRSSPLAAGLKQPSISELETGETKEISGPTLIAISQALKIRPEWLVTGHGEMDESTASHGMQLAIEEALAVKKLREAAPAWRRYVLSLAMVDKPQQDLLLQTMRQAVPDYKVEQAFGTAPHAREARAPLLYRRSKAADTGRKAKAPDKLILLRCLG